MNTAAERLAFRFVIRAAVGWLASRKDLCTSPHALMSACVEWRDATIKRLIESDEPIDEFTMKTELVFAGECAAKDVAMPAPQQFIAELINPEDLQ